MSERALSFLVVVLVGALGFVAAVVWGMTGVVVVFAAAVLWWIWYVGALSDQIEEARAGVEELRGEVSDIKAHLTGLEEPSTGRHADGEPATYRPTPYPRTDLSRRTA